MFVLFEWVRARNHGGSVLHPVQRRRRPPPDPMRQVSGGAQSRGRRSPRARRVLEARRDRRGPGPGRPTRTTRRRIFALRVLGQVARRSGSPWAAAACRARPRPGPPARSASAVALRVARAQHHEARRAPRPSARRARRSPPIPPPPDARPATDSTSAGPSRLPAILIVSSERPSTYQRPSSVHVGPVAVDPEAVEAAPVRLEVALPVAPEAAGHAGPGLRIASSPTSPRTRPALGVDDVGRHAGQRPGERAGTQVRDHVAAEDAARDLGSARVVDDRKRPPPTS